MAYKQRGFTAFTKINDDDKKINAVIVNDNSNKSDTISNDRDKNVCLPIDFNCPDSRKRIAEEFNLRSNPDGKLKPENLINNKKQKAK